MILNKNIIEKLKEIYLQYEENETLVNENSCEKNVRHKQFSLRAQ